jgi:hypothetical protein
MSAALSIPPGAMNRIGGRIASDFGKKFTSARHAIADAVLEVAGDTAVALAERTFPSVMAIGYAVRSVRSDVSSVYATPGKIFAVLESKDPVLAGKFWAAMKKGDLSSARQIVQQSGTSVANIRIGGSLDPALHEKSRNNNGTVTIPAPLQMCTKEEIAQYTKTVIAQLGKTASGWSACAAELGQTVPTNWKSVAVHGRSGGHIRPALSPQSISITLVNTRPLARKHLSPGQAATIRKNAAEYLGRAIQSRLSSMS